MEWNGPIKAVSVRLPEDLHNAIKSEAPRRQDVATIERAYQLALESWLMPDANITPKSDEEREAVAMVLAHIRSGRAVPSLEGDAMPIPSFLRSTIASIVANLKNDDELAFFQKGLRFLASVFNLDSPAPTQENGITIVRKNST